MARTAVIGSGAWGTTLAKILVENGHEAWLWCHDETLARTINASNENRFLLPDIQLPAGLRATASLEEACQDCDLVVMVTASQFFGATLDRLTPLLVRPGTLVVSATKGLIEATGERPSEVLAQKLPAALQSRVAVLSGPNIAREIAQQKPATTVISSAHPDTAQAVQRLFHNHYFRVYTNGDVPGTELGGTLKNIIAIAAGIVEGLGLGDNAKAAVMVRGLAEISRFAAGFGARPETFFGLAGIGDLITTCSSPLSRNNHVGRHLGKGWKLPKILETMTAVAEGVNTARLIWPLAQKRGVAMPVTEQVYRVLFEDKAVEEALRDLMGRELKAETA